MISKETNNEYPPIHSTVLQRLHFSQIFQHLIPNSSLNPHSQTSSAMSAEAPKPARPCDYCGHSTAVLYCRADSAKLCFSCDREVHSTNQLFSKHTRTLLCDACDDSPATILCSTDTSVLCQNCDWEKHNPALSDSLHQRRPLEGFTGCPSVSELLSVVGFGDLSKKSLLSSPQGSAADGFLGCEIEGLSDFFVWDAPSVVTLDDLICSSASSHSFQAMEVPPLPKVHTCMNYGGRIAVKKRDFFLEFRSREVHRTEDLQLV